MSDLIRVDVGFQGGQVLSVRARVDSYDALAAALRDGGAGAWHGLETDDSQILVDLAQIVYVRRESGDQKVGF